MTNPTGQAHQPITEPGRSELEFIAQALQDYELRNLNERALVVIGFGPGWTDYQEYEVYKVGEQVALTAGGNQVLWHIQDLAKDREFTEVWVGTNNQSVNPLPWAVPPENRSFPVPVKKFHINVEGVLAFRFDGAPHTIQPWPSQDQDPREYLRVSGDLQERIHNTIGTNWNDTVDTDQYVTELYADRLQWMVVRFGQDLTDDRVSLEEVSEAAALLGTNNILEPILNRQWEPEEIDGFEVIAKHCAPIHQDQANLALGLAALASGNENEKQLIIAALEKVPEHHSRLARPLAAALAAGLSVAAGHDDALQAGPQQWATGTFTIEPTSTPALGVEENLLQPLPPTSPTSPGFGI